MANICPFALWQEDFADFSDSDREDLPEGASVACTTFIAPNGKWVLHYMGFQISLPGEGPWWVEQNEDGYWMVTNGSKRKLCSNLVSLDRAVMSRTQSKKHLLHYCTKKNTGICCSKQYINFASNSVLLNF